MASASARSGDEVSIDGRRAVVTGAGGFIGSATCRRLAAEGARVVGLEVDAEAAQRVAALGVKPRVADVSDEGALAEALSDAELVVHTAAYVRETGTMDEFIRVNVIGTANVLAAAEAAGAERVLHISSVVVYGFVDEREQDESAYRRAVGLPYLDTKSASDALACRRGAVVIRAGDVYGPGSRPWLVRPVQIARDGPFPLPGGGDRVMLPVYIDDLVESLVLGLRRGRAGRAYTVWDGSSLSFGDYFGRLFEAVGARPPRNLPRPVISALATGLELAARLRGRTPDFGRQGVIYVDRRGTVSNRRAREELGWDPQVSLDEGLRRSVEWLRAEGIA